MSDYKEQIKLLASKTATLPQAIECQREALRLFPDNQEFIVNLAALLTKIGRTNESLQILEEALVKYPKNWDIYNKIGANLFFLSQFEKLEQVIDKIFSYGEEVAILTRKTYFIAAVYTAYIQGNYAKAREILTQHAGFIGAYLKGDIAESQKLLQNSSMFTFEDIKTKSPAIIYIFYFHNLVQFYEKNKQLYQQNWDKTLHVIGESHCLAPAHLILNLADGNYRCKPHPILSCRIWELISSKENLAKSALAVIIEQIPAQALVLFCIGEVDCRINRGIIGFYRNNPNIDLTSHIANMSKNYVELIANLAKQKSFTAMIQGIPASNENISAYPEHEQKTLYFIIKQLNDYLKNDCQKHNIRFLDLYSLTVNPETSTANKKYHIDFHHMIPTYIKELLE